MQCSYSASLVPRSSAARASSPALTEKDEDDLRFGLQLGVDNVALSFMRAPSDLDKVRAIMAEVGILRPVCVKIEKAEAVAVLEDIIKAADAVMLSAETAAGQFPSTSTHRERRTSLKRLTTSGLKSARWNPRRM